MADQEDVRNADDLEFRLREIKRFVQGQLNEVKEGVNHMLEETREKICRKLEDVLDTSKKRMSHAQDGNDRTCLDPPVQSVIKQLLPSHPKVCQSSTLPTKEQLKRKVAINNERDEVDVQKKKKMAVQGQSAVQKAAQLASRSQPSGSGTRNTIPSTSTGPGPSTSTDPGPSTSTGSSSSKSSFGISRVLPVHKQILQFKVSIHRFKPPVWRRIQFLEDATFFDLHVGIQRAFEWSGHHIHDFVIKKEKSKEKNWNEIKRHLSGIDFLKKYEEMRPDPYYIGNYRLPTDVGKKQPFIDGLGYEKYNEKRAKLIDHFQINELRCNYRYDLSFPWEHDVLLETILPVETANRNFVYPRLVGGRHVTPPEEDPGSDFEYDADAKWKPSDVNMLEGPGDYLLKDAVEFELDL